MHAADPRAVSLQNARRYQHTRTVSGRRPRADAHTKTTNACSSLHPQVIRGARKVMLTYRNLGNAFRLVLSNPSCTHCFNPRAWDSRYASREWISIAGVKVHLNVRSTHTCEGVVYRETLRRQDGRLSEMNSTASKRTRDGPEIQGGYLSHGKAATRPCAGRFACWFALTTPTVKGMLSK